MKKCVVCENELNGNKSKYCSNKCKSKAHYYDRKNSNTYHSQTLRGLSRKIEFINLKGGSCIKCGYNKNISVLEFNHLCCKLFPLDLRNLSNRNKKDLLDELDKCELLCANCHREYHNPELNIEKVTNLLFNNRKQ